MNTIALDQYDAWLFDLDGTLIDSVPDLTLAVNAALQEHDLSLVDDDQVRHWVGNGSAKLIERALQFLNVWSEDNQSQFHHAFLDAYGKVLNAKSALYPDVMALISLLKRENKKLALITNKPQQFLPELLARFHLDDVFECVIGGDTLPAKKPDPLPVNHCLTKLAVTQGRALMVGDSRSDALSAQAAGVDVCLLQQGYHQGVDLASLNPNYLLADIAQLFSMLENAQFE